MTAALRMARTKYGDHLGIEGDDAFKRVVVETAARHEMAVTLTDPDMEKRRQVLSHTLTQAPPQPSLENDPRKRPHQGYREAEKGLER